ncbi:universal stress protein [Ornithinimicrobium avium]|uniref:Universal stress protein n=1 Tax=Ornithinimicrobium avium TaxID=2283195 RepID=A0A345NQQ3_9MICO|nr:universal stress protein [Ornithinimicrobium avium]AXH97361.1 universal stress protein [Ornithinimicrobium avium]
MSTTPTPHVVVGVVLGQPAAVARTAATFADRFGADLVCACVDPARYPLTHDVDRPDLSVPVDPDLLDLPGPGLRPALETMLSEHLRGLDVRWSVRALAGGPARELARLADELDAAMIVVGTREAGLRESLRELVNGSVAAHLAHRQHRPVLVVPLAPAPARQDQPSA